MSGFQNVNPLGPRRPGDCPATLPERGSSDWKIPKGKDGKDKEFPAKEILKPSPPIEAPAAHCVVG